MLDTIELDNISYIFSIPKRTIINNNDDSEDDDVDDIITDQEDTNGGQNNNNNGQQNQTPQTTTTPALLTKKTADDYRDKLKNYFNSYNFNNRIYVSRILGAKSTTGIGIKVQKKDKKYYYKFNSAYINSALSHRYKGNNKNYKPLTKTEASLLYSKLYSIMYCANLYYKYYYNLRTYKGFQSWKPKDPKTKKEISSNVYFEEYVRKAIMNKTQKSEIVALRDKFSKKILAVYQKELYNNLKYYADEYSFYFYFYAKGKNTTRSALLASYKKALYNKKTAKDSHDYYLKAKAIIATKKVSGWTFYHNTFNSWDMTTAIKNNTKTVYVYDNKKKVLKSFSQSAPYWKYIMAAAISCGASVPLAAGMVGNAAQETGGTLYEQINPYLTVGHYYGAWCTNYRPGYDPSMYGLDAYDQTVRVVKVKISNYSGYYDCNNYYGPYRAAVWFEDKYERSGGSQVGTRGNQAERAYAAWKSMFGW